MSVEAIWSVAVRGNWVRGLSLVGPREQLLIIGFAHSEAPCQSVCK